MLKPVVAFVVAGLAMFCLARQEITAQPHAISSPPRWEYKIVIDRQTRLIEPRLKELGEQGWELVSVSDSPDSPDGSQLFIFKRGGSRG